MKILVIGGSRFIGLAAVNRLQELGHEVAVCNRGKTCPTPSEGVTWIEGDRDRLGDSRSEFQKFQPDVVLHNVVVTGSHGESAVEVFRGVAGRLVMVSSCDVYRAYGRLTGVEPGAPDPVPIVEDSPLREKRYPYRDHAPDKDHLYYMYDKIPAEEAVLASADPPGTVLRLPMVIGPNDYQHRLFGYLKPMQDDRPAIVLEEGYAAWKSTYDYVDNVADAMILACTNEKAAGRVYNVGSWSQSTQEMAAEVARAMEWNGKIVVAPKSRLPEELHEDLVADQPLVCSDRRLREELGFTERISLQDAIHRTVEWERDNPPDPIPPGLLNYEVVDRVLQESGES